MESVVKAEAEVCVVFPPVTSAVFPYSELSQLGNVHPMTSYEGTLGAFGSTNPVIQEFLQSPIHMPSTPRHKLVRPARNLGVSPILSAPPYWRPGGVWKHGVYTKDGDQEFTDEYKDKAVEVVRMNNTHK